MDSDRKKISQAAHDHYASGEQIWSSDDRWNERKRVEIEKFCVKHLSGISLEEKSVLNAGSGSHRYDWLPETVISLDLFSEQLKNTAYPVLGSVENIPFPENFFDVIVCVGSVINYASALESISEMSRVLRPTGVIVLHFESSESLEQIATKNWKSEAAPIETLNNGEVDMVWVYSRNLIFDILNRTGIKILDKDCFHTISAALSRIGIPQQYAAFGQSLDFLVPFLNCFSDDVIIFGQKIESTKF